MAMLVVAVPAQEPKSTATTAPEPRQVQRRQEEVLVEQDAHIPAALGTDLMLPILVVAAAARTPPPALAVSEVLVALAKCVSLS